jgi:hypothetical protein
MNVFQSQIDHMGRVRGFGGMRSRSGDDLHGLVAHGMNRNLGLGHMFLNRLLGMAHRLLDMGWFRLGLRLGRRLLVGGLRM